MIQVRDELVGMIDGELRKWYEVKSNMLGQLNRMIKEKSLDVIILK
jgi:hypothetical protein